jgi:hypothetical protein
MTSILSPLVSSATTAANTLVSQATQSASQAASLVASESAAASQAGGTADSGSVTNAAISSTDTLGNEDTFLQLLVAQIKNQDPTQPVDSSTFLSQLAEFSQLEQLMGIRQDVSELDPTSASSTSTSSASTTPTSTTAGTQS